MVFLITNRGSSALPFNFPQLDDHSDHSSPTPSGSIIPMILCEAHNTDEYLISPLHDLLSDSIILDSV